MRHRAIVILFVAGFALLGIGVILLTLMLRNQASVEVTPKLFETPEFSLTNCNGEQITKESLLGKVWLVDFIFTRCPGPCPLMTQTMKSLQTRLQRESGIEDCNVTLLSISVDPAYDSPEVLLDYAQRAGADLDNWYFLTGPEGDTQSLIRGGFKIAVTRDEDSGLVPPIVHGTNFLLVDGSGWVRRILNIQDDRFLEDAVDSINDLCQENTARP